jgi:hypothetical protein
MRKDLARKFGVEVEGTFKDYDELNIRPHHIHRTKSEHTYAIFLLSSTIGKILSEKGNVPRSVASRLSDTGEKLGKEIARKKR